MARLSNFTEDRWFRMEQRWIDWWQGTSPDPMVVLECLPEKSRYDFFSIYGHLTRFPLDIPAEKIIEDIDRALGEVEYLGDGFPRWWLNFGAGFLAALLGSRVEFVEDNTWFHPVDFPKGFSTKIEFSSDSRWKERLWEISRVAADRWGKSVLLGYPDIGGDLDILASLFGSSELLMACMDQPGEVERLSERVNELWMELFTEYEALLSTLPTRSWRGSWIPAMAGGSTYPLQCDFSIMISPEMFERFALPGLKRCCREIDFPFYHLDGPGSERHLEALLSIEELKGIQWIPGAGAPPAEEWIDLLGRIKAGGKLCQVYTGAAGARRICDELGGEGFLFCIGGDKAMLPTPEEGETCLDMLVRGGHYHG